MAPFKARLYEAEGESGESHPSEERPPREYGQGARPGTPPRGVAAA